MKNKKTVKHEMGKIYKGLREKEYLRSLYEYIKVCQKDRKDKKEYNSDKKHIFKQRFSGFSSEASESMTLYILSKNLLLKELGKKSCELTGRTRTGSNDILINKKYSIEVKATSSESGLITVSKNNLKCYAWIWMDLRLLLDGKSNVVDIHVIKNPGKNIFTWVIDTNKEHKMDIKTMVKGIKHSKDYELLHLDIDSFKINPETVNGNKFFSYS
jgi:hypothetical protein